MSNDGNCQSRLSDLVSVGDAPHSGAAEPLQLGRSLDDAATAAMIGFNDDNQDKHEDIDMGGFAVSNGEVSDLSSASLGSGMDVTTRRRSSEVPFVDDMSTPTSLSGFEEEMGSEGGVDGALSSEKMSAVIAEAQRQSYMQAGSGDADALASQALNFEHSSESFSIEDLMSLLFHFQAVDKASDGTVSRTEFADCFALLGVRGFLVDLLFEAWTWDEEIRPGRLSVKHFVCGFCLLTRGSASQKLSVAFSMYAQDHDGSIGVAEAEELFRSLHRVLIRIDSNSQAGSADSFTNLMMHAVFVATATDGRPVREVSKSVFLKACERQQSLFKCIDRMQEPTTESKRADQRLRERDEATDRALRGRATRYRRAGLRGVDRFLLGCCPQMLSRLRPRERRKSDGETAGMAVSLSPLSSSSGPGRGASGGREAGEDGGGGGVGGVKARVRRHAVVDRAMGRESWTHLLSLLLGIRRSIERLTLHNAPLNNASFTGARVIQVPGHVFAANAPGRATAATGTLLLMRDYAPTVFRNLRAIYEVDDLEFVRSLSPIPILGNLVLGNLQRLSSLISEGKSGSILYFSQDRRYVIKTITKREHSAFRKVLKHYYSYIRSNPHTFIIRFFGLYDLVLANGTVIYFTVMANVFETKDVHRRYDIKGSSAGRSALEGSKKPSYSLESICLKDNDLDFSFVLQPASTRRDLFVQIKSDADWLSSFGLIDYSLLIGVHFVPGGNADGDAAAKNGPESVSDGGNHTFWRSRFQVVQGGLSCQCSGDGREAIIFVAIIDCFTHYGWRKRLERFAKIAMGYKSRDVSVMPPKAYAQRFVWAVCERVFGSDRVQLIVPDDEFE